MTTRTTRPVFYLIAIIIPFVLLGLAEVGLRTFGFGKTVPLFVESADMPGYLQTNPNIIQRYFANPNAAPNVSPDTVFFQKNKAETTFRIVVQGGSTAAGFPYGRFGSLQGMLEQRFKRTYPHKNIEVINTAMAAVNSYTLMDFVDEIIEIEPDLILIYAGHNEYLGVMGVGSTFAARGGRSATLAFLLLKDLRLYQLVQTLYTWWNGELSKDGNEPSRSLMSKVAKGQHIAYDSPLYHKGIEQFRDNLKVILSKYKAQQIPVLLANLVSNEQDQPPFSSIGKVDWQQAVKSSDLSTEQIHLLNKTDDDASKAYLSALSFVNNRKFNEALEQFINAKDLDQLRFRAPSAFNQVISDLAAEDGVSLVNVEQLYRQDSRLGIIDQQLMLEHVHPTLRGYFILAESFYTAIKNTGLIGDEYTSVTRQKAWLDVPVTEFDEAWAQLKIKQLKSDYPFKVKFEPLPEFTPRSEIDYLLIERAQGIDWIAQQKKLISIYKANKQLGQAAKVYGVLSDALINSPIAANDAALIYRQISDIPISTFYQRRALKLDPDNQNYILNLAHNYFLLKQFDSSLSLLIKAKAKLKDTSRVDFFIGKVEQAIRLKNEN
ncbi:hypothetical protein Q4575_07905 [Psychrosphaera sp. 1_MG-2023]|uniref:hypothetical protein n=1 Tax=Psychrosphaera sp. 1_MG-2023 TaxID=3062643 RepID=UPI0026E21159|nr:hypothetical protein [Psychrosphaera sp. 1_MG-2023]MDO6719318.1 hypothetical protein [Psychrosphaera sp. 1_MG-2023]